MSEHLAHLARRAACDPFFLGWSLARYQERARLCDTALIAELCIEMAALDLLRLCRRPDAGSPRYADDVARIAAKIGCDAVALGRIVTSV